jgi:hypothetical protein
MFIKITFKWHAHYKGVSLQVTLFNQTIRAASTCIVPFKQKPSTFPE